VDAHHRPHRVGARGTLRDEVRPPARDAYSTPLRSLVCRRGQCQTRCTSGSAFHPQCLDQQRLPHCIRGKSFQSSLCPPYPAAARGYESGGPDRGTGGWGDRDRLPSQGGRRFPCIPVEAAGFELSQSRRSAISLPRSFGGTCAPRWRGDGCLFVGSVIDDDDEFRRRALEIW
jgi:hypothetical protein